MHDNRYLVRVEPEKPFRLDHLEAFIHKGRGINGDLFAHLPVRVVESFGPRRAAYLFFCFLPKWSARGSQNQALDLAFVFPSKTLVDRVVFAVNWEDL